MKNYRKTITILLMAAALLAAVFMTGCTRRTEVPDTTTPDATAPDTAAGTAGPGVYVRMERSDAGSIFLRGSGFSKVGKNADGTLLKVGEWLYTGDDIVQVAREENSSVLFTVGALAADDTLLAEGSFLYDTAQEKLYVTISEDGVTCATSDAADAPADVQPVLTLPAAAVQQNGDGFFAWVVNADGNAERRPLNVAGQIGQQFQIASGVKPGERAITDGAQRVQPGAAVQILN